MALRKMTVRTSGCSVRLKAGDVVVIHDDTRAVDPAVLAPVADIPGSVPGVSYTAEEARVLRGIDEDLLAYVHEAKTVFAGARVVSGKAAGRRKGKARAHAVDVEKTMAEEKTDQLEGR